MSEILHFAGVFLSHANIEVTDETIIGTLTVMFTKNYLVYWKIKIHFNPMDTKLIAN